MSFVFVVINGTDDVVLFVSVVPVVPVVCCWYCCYVMLYVFLVNTCCLYTYVYLSTARLCAIFVIYGHCMCILNQ